jgi:hypothetical protein
MKRTISCAVVTQLTSYPMFKGSNPSARENGWGVKKKYFVLDLSHKSFITMTIKQRINEAHEQQQQL